MFKDFIDRFNSKYLPWWKGLSNSRKATFAASSVLVLIISIFLGNVLLKANYQILYRNLDTTEAGQIVDHLTENKIPYQLSQGGTTILVSGRDIQKVRLELAASGLPKSGQVGYEIFDQTNLGMTDFLQKVNYRRALEGELAKTITHLNEIKSARVHLVIPEPRLFKEDKIEPTASIVLHLNRSMPLSPKQVEGIIYLVATSVEGLSAENITILDSSGRLLSNRQSSDKLVMLSSNQLEMKKNVESYLEDKAQSMLDAVLGRNRSIVRVSTILNFDQVERTVESYDPDNIAVRSEESTEEKQSESDATNPDQKKDMSNSKKNTIRNYEVNKTIEHLVDQVGNIEKLHVSVSIDGTYEMIKGPDGNSVRQYAARPQEELDKIIALVKGAVGYSDERKDVLEVANIPFETVQDDWEETQQFERQEQTKYWIQIAYKIFGAVLVLFVLLKMRKRYLAWKDKHLAHRRFAEAQQEIQRKAAEIIPKVSREPKLIDHMRKIADDTPEEIAKAIKTMMVE